MKKKRKKKTATYRQIKKAMEKPAPKVGGWPLRLEIPPDVHVKGEVSIKC